MDATDDGNTVIIAGPEFQTRATTGRIRGRVEWNGTAYARKGQEFRGPHYRRYGAAWWASATTASGSSLASHTRIFYFYDRGLGAHPRLRVAQPQKKWVNMDEENVLVGDNDFVGWAIKGAQQGRHAPLRVDQ